MKGKMKMKKTETRTENIKRVYIAPRIESILIEVEGNILQGSGTTTPPSPSFGADAASTTNQGTIIVAPW
jgi:hypothetical protein